MFLISSETRSRVPACLLLVWLQGRQWSRKWPNCLPTWRNICFVDVIIFCAAQRAVFPVFGGGKKCPSPTASSHSILRTAVVDDDVEAGLPFSCLPNDKHSLLARHLPLLVANCPKQHLCLAAQQAYCYSYCFSG